MKKIFKYSLSIIIFSILLIMKVEASSALVSVTANKTSLVVGNNVTVTVKLSSSSPLGAWEYDLSYDSKKLKLTSGEARVVGYVNDNNTKTKTYTYTFKALKSGTTTVTVANLSINAFDESKMSTSSLGKATIKVITQEQLQQSYSKDNTLKSLSIKGYTLTPEFSKDKTEYTLEVENDCKTIEVLAKTNDAKAKLTGTGTKELNEGPNKITIQVTAENGNIKTYTINVTVKELNQIKVTIDSSIYTIIRKEGILPPPEHYEKSTTIIDGEEVLCYISRITNYTLIGLTDEKGTSAYYIYKDDTYKKYNEINFDKINIAILEMDKSIIPNNYIKTVISINNKELDVYKLNESSNYSLLYGINTETGKKNLYVYDSIEHTLGTYNDEETTILTNKIIKYTKIIIGLTITIGLIIIIFVIYTILINKKYKEKEITLRKSLLNKQ